MMKKIFALLSLLFTTQNVFADFITQNIPNACNINKKFFTHFTINSYTCNPGEYLPAYTLGCRTCPSGYTCNGGTFNFNDTEFQGAEHTTTITTNMNNLCAANSPKGFSAKFTRNTHICSLGYYLPAGVDNCTKCSVDNYCSGGTYTFNETTAQGITPCPSAHPFAPAGMWQQSQCGRILHIGNEIIYLHQTPAHPTEHRLYTIVNGTVYSANMTLSDTPMNSQTERKLKTRFGNNTYYVFDDSMETNR